MYFLQNRSGDLATISGGMSFLSDGTTADFLLKNYIFFITYRIIIKKYLFLGILLPMFSLTHVSQSFPSKNYTTMMHIIRHYLPSKQGEPYDLTEYRAQVILSKDDVFGDKEEILQLSDAGCTLFSSLAEEEKAKLPKNILFAKPGSFAMKFYSSSGCCSRKYITETQPTEDDLDRQSHEVRFV